MSIEENTGRYPTGRATAAETTVSTLRDDIPNAEFPNPYGSPRERVAYRIKTASVLRKTYLPGGLESRSLGYYASVGIDYFGHDHESLDQLFLNAADAVLNAEAIDARSAETGTGSVHESAGRKASPKQD